jgi:hypothetical protein
MKDLLSKLNIDIKRYDSEFYFRYHTYGQLTNECIVTRLYDNNKVVYLAHIHIVNSGETILLYNHKSPISNFDDSIKNCKKSDGFYVGSDNILSKSLKEVTGLNSDWVQSSDWFQTAEYYLDSDLGRFKFDENGLIVKDRNNHDPSSEEPSDVSNDCVLLGKEYCMDGNDLDAKLREMMSSKKSEEKPKEKVIGEFKTDLKFIEFIGAKGNINFLSNEAFVEGKYLSGLGLENVKFKLTICDEKTLNFEEVDTNVTTKEQRQRLLNVIEEKTIVPFRKRMVVKELEFTSIQEVSGKKISLYLAVEYTTPIEKLSSIFDEEVEVSQSQMNKLDELMSLFDDIIDEGIDEYESDEVVESKEEENSNALNHNVFLEDQFSKLKEEKIKKLKSDLENSKSNLLKYGRDKKFAESKVEEFTSEIRLLESRLDTLQPIAPENGYYFNVSQRLNEEIVLEKEIYELIKSKVDKVKGINGEAFMKLFEEGQFQIRLAQKTDGEFVEVTNFENLPTELLDCMSDLNLKIDEGKLFYIGEMIWAVLVNKFIKLGFIQDSEWDKFCNSNSYSTKLDESIL